MVSVLLSRIHISSSSLLSAMQVLVSDVLGVESLVGQCGNHESHQSTT